MQGRPNNKTKFLRVMIIAKSKLTLPTHLINEPHSPPTPNHYGPSISIEEKSLPPHNFTNTSYPPRTF